MKNCQHLLYDLLNASNYTGLRNVSTSVQWQNGNLTINCLYLFFAWEMDNSLNGQLYVNDAYMVGINASISRVVNNNWLHISTMRKWVNAFCKMVKTL